jgi:hypothetical protein
VQDNVYLSYLLTNSFASLAELKKQLDATIKAGRDAYNATNGTPGYASGGDFGGGIMSVGERGPELVATGAARVHTAEQLNAPVVRALERIENRLAAIERGNADVARDSRVRAKAKSN